MDIGAEFKNGCEAFDRAIGASHLLESKFLQYHENFDVFLMCYEIFSIALCIIDSKIYPLAVTTTRDPFIFNIT